MHGKGMIWWMWMCWCMLAALTPLLAQNAKHLPAVPVLCYHQIREHQFSDDAFAKAITVAPARFAEQMKALADSGFHAILPGQLYDYYASGKPLPAKPVLISFDDNTISQYTAALPVLDRYGMKAVFFVMTVAVGKPGYMTKAQLLQLARQGHVLGGHGWDHKDVRHYDSTDWKRQIDKPHAALASWTGQQVDYFAFPYGATSPGALQALQQRKVKLAFVLDRAPASPLSLLTLRRLMVTNDLRGPQLIRRMRSMFP